MVVDYCPNCGDSLKTGPIARAFSWKSGNPNKPPAVIGEVGSPPPCTVCGDRLSRRDLLAWCTYCGRAAHREEMLERLQKERTCPKCGQELDRESFANYLSST